MEGNATPSESGTPTLSRKRDSSKDANNKENRSSFVDTFASFTESTNTPAEAKSAPEPVKESNTDTLTLKLKIRELTNSLKNVTQQRDEALGKAKVTNDVAPAVFNEAKESNLSKAVDELTNKLDEANNAQSALRELTRSLRAENDEIQGRTHHLQDENLSLTGTAKDLRDQVSSMFDDLASLADEAEKLKAQVKQLTESNKQLLTGDNLATIDQIRHENREKEAAQEHRIAQLLEKLNIAESLKADIECQVKTHIEKIASLEAKIAGDGFKAVALVDPAELINEKALVKALENENKTLKESVKKLSKSASTSQTHLSSVSKTHDVIVSELHATIDKLQAKLLKNCEANNIQKRLAALNGDASIIPPEVGEVAASSEIELERDDTKLTTVELKSLLAEKEKELEAALLDNRKIKDQLESNAGLTGDVDRLKEEKDQVEVKLEEALVLQSELQVEIVNLNKQISNLRNNDATVTELQAEIAKLKVSLQGKDDGMAEIVTQMSKVKEQLSDAEEKKSKSIQLLRQSKNRIIKLEGDLKQAEEDRKQTKELLMGSSVKNSEIEAFQLQIQTLNEAVHKGETMIKQFELANQRLKDECSEVQEKYRSSSIALQQKEDRMYVIEAKLQETTESKEREIENLHNEMRDLNRQIADWDSRVSSSDVMIENMEQDLETSKKLFQTKSIENDTLKLRISELEGKLYEASEELANHSEKVETHAREANEAKAQLRSKHEEMERLQSHMDTLTKGTATQKEKNKVTEGQQQELNVQIQALQDTLKKLGDSKLAISEELSKTKVLNINSKLRLLDIEERFKTATKERILWTKEKETLLSDFRTREMQLKVLNKVMMFLHSPLRKSVGNLELILIPLLQALRHRLFHCVHLEVQSARL
jgi:chromosome segregation ATPase